MGNQFLMHYSLIVEVMLVNQGWSLPTRLTLIVPNLRHEACGIVTPSLARCAERELGLRAEKLSLCCGEQMLIQ